MNSSKPRLVYARIRGTNMEGVALIPTLRWSPITDWLVRLLRTANARIATKPQIVVNQQGMKQ